LVHRISSGKLPDKLEIQKECCMDSFLFVSAVVFSTMDQDDGFAARRQPETHARAKQRVMKLATLFSGLVTKQQR